jgi:hypothetical protein
MVADEDGVVTAVHHTDPTNQVSLTSLATEAGLHARYSSKLH